MPREPDVASHSIMPSIWLAPLQNRRTEGSCSRCGLQPASAISTVFQASVVASRLRNRSACVHAAPAAISENDFECLASAGVNAVGTVFPYSIPLILSFLQATLLTSLGFYASTSRLPVRTSVTRDQATNRGECCDALYACVAGFALRMPEKLSRF